MLVPGDLGFRFVAVFIFVVFPAIFLFLRRQWRLAVAKRDEINRLLVLASEEAAQAELEASSSIGFDYSFPTKTPAFAAAAAAASASVPSPQRLCAVCYTPTQNRCARCKSVHYCSGKCQIIHWRQGHKYECTPSLVSYEDEEAVNLSGKAVGQPHSDDYIGRTEGDPIKYVKKDDNAHKRGFTNHSPSSSVFAERGNLNTVTLPVHERELDVSVEIRGISVTSGARQSVPDDVVCIESISDDDSLHDINSDLSNSSSSLDNLGAAVSNDDVEEAKLEDAYTGVVYNGNISASYSPQEEVSDKKSASSGFNISYSNKQSIEPSRSSSGFWDGSLEHTRITNDSCSYNAKPKFDGSGERKSSVSFSLQSSLDSPGKMLSDLHSQSVKASHHLHAGTSKADKLVEPILLDKRSMDSAKQGSSTNFSPGRPETRVKKINVPGVLMKSNEDRSVADTLGCNELPSFSAKGLNVLDKDTRTPTLPSVSDKAGASTEISKGSSSYVKKGNISSAVKTVKSDGNGVIIPQSTSSMSGVPGGMKTSMLKVVEQLKAPKLLKQGVGVGRSIEKGIFPYELFVKLYHWNKVELRPFGLINCGNSCYANVVLQCLAFTPPLTAYLLEGLHTKTCVNKEWCFLCEFERLILKGKEGGSPISPIGILSQIQKIGSHLSNGREEDAHEFLRYAIDTMQYVCLREARASASNPLEEETTLMGLTFGGYLRSKIKCTRCHGKSERQERMMDLTVEIGGDIETLEDALRQFTGTESLDGENKYHCGRCKSYEKAKKKLSISEAPNVLTIALKRFQSGKFGKLNKSIRFPEILNLAPYMRGSSDKSPIYRLYGVVVHLDVMNASFSGHYVCYVRNIQNKWYKIDDSMVKVVESERVLSKGAYMLFYSRCSPRAPKSIRSNIISRDLANKMKNSEVGPSWTHGRNNTSRHRDLSVETNHINDDMANLGYLHQDETRRIPRILEFDSSSDNSSLFSHSDEVSSNTDSTRESISADDFSDFIFGWRPPSDSDSSSSSSSSSSSPLCTKHSPLSHSERYSSDISEPSGSQTSNGKNPCWTCKAEESGSGAGVSFLQSNSSKQQSSRELVNSSDSCRGIDSKIIGRANPLDNTMSGVRLRSSSRKTG